MRRDKTRTDHRVLGHQRQTLRPRRPGGRLHGQPAPTEHTAPPPKVDDTTRGHTIRSPHTETHHSRGAVSSRHTTPLEKANGPPTLNPRTPTCSQKQPLARFPPCKRTTRRRRASAPCLRRGKGRRTLSLAAMLTSTARPTTCPLPSWYRAKLPWVDVITKMTPLLPTNPGTALRTTAAPF